MAYSDYGGYAFKNGKRVKEQSDKDGYHVLLGDNGIQLGLYKQCDVTILKNGALLDYESILKDKYPEAVKDDYIDTEYFSDSDKKVEIEINGTAITIYYLEEENYYTFAALKYPDETFWCGFSGYGVGAGLENCGYGYSTEDQIKRLEYFFKSQLPDGLKED